MEGDYPASGDVYKGAVIWIEGLGNDYFIAVVKYAVEHHLKGFGTAGGYKYIAVGKLYAYFAIIILYCVYKYRKAGGWCILKNGQGEIPHRFKVSGRCFNIGLTNVQVIDLYSLFIALQLIGVVLANWGKTAFFDFAGKFHLQCASG